MFRRTSSSQCLARGNVLKAVDGSLDRAAVVPQRADIHKGNKSGAVRAFHHDFSIPCRYAVLNGVGHRAFRGKAGHRQAEQPMRSAKAVLASAIAGVLPQSSRLRRCSAQTILPDRTNRPRLAWRRGRSARRPKGRRTPLACAQRSEIPLRSTFVPLVQTDASASAKRKQNWMQATEKSKSSALLRLGRRTTSRNARVDQRFLGVVQCGYGAQRCAQQHDLPAKA